MASGEDASFRMLLALGFLDEARQDLALQRWRSCVDNSQLAVENAAKAILALLGPVGRTHGPAEFLRAAVDNGGFLDETAHLVVQVVESAEQLGWDVHVASDYGDEVERRTPWQLFDETDARQALNLAEAAVMAARGVVDAMLGQ